jgi:hypothetical protein
MHVTLMESGEGHRFGQDPCPWFVIKGSRYFNPVRVHDSQLLWPSEVVEDTALVLPPSRATVASTYVTPDGDCTFITYSDGTTVKFCTDDFEAQVSVSLELLEGVLQHPHTL